MGELVRMGALLGVGVGVFLAVAVLIMLSPLMIAPAFITFVFLAWPMSLLPSRRAGS